LVVAAAVVARQRKRGERRRGVRHDSGAILPRPRLVPRPCAPLLTAVLFLQESGALAMRKPGLRLCAGRVAGPPEGEGAKGQKGRGTPFSGAVFAARSVSLAGRC
jgi:hypothetical protein